MRERGGGKKRERGLQREMFSCLMVSGFGSKSQGKHLGLMNWVLKPRTMNWILVLKKANPSFENTNPNNPKHFDQSE